MPPKANPKVLEAVRLVLAGDDPRTALGKAGLDFSDSARRNVRKQAQRQRQLAEEAAVVAPEVMTEVQKTASKAVATAAAALAMAEGAQKAAATAAAASVQKTSDVVGGRRTRKQAQVVWARQDAEKRERKERKSKAHKGATLAYEAEMKKPRSERQTSARVCELFNEQHALSPKSELKRVVIMKAVRDGKAGESPSTQGRKPKIPRQLLVAAVAKGGVGQTVGITPSSKSIVLDMKAAALGTPHEKALSGTTAANGHLRRLVRKA